MNYSSSNIKYKILNMDGAAVADTRTLVDRMRHNYTSAIATPKEVTAWIL